METVWLALAVVLLISVVLYMMDGYYRRPKGKRAEKKRAEEKREEARRPRGYFEEAAAIQAKLTSMYTPCEIAAANRRRDAFYHPQMNNGGRDGFGLQAAHSGSVYEVPGVCSRGACEGRDPDKDWRTDNNCAGPAGDHRCAIASNMLLSVPWALPDEPRWHAADLEYSGVGTARQGADYNVGDGGVHLAYPNEMYTYPSRPDHDMLVGRG